VAPPIVHASEKRATGRIRAFVQGQEFSPQTVGQHVPFRESSVRLTVSDCLWGNSSDAWDEVADRRRDADRDARDDDRFRRGGTGDPGGNRHHRLLVRPQEEGHPARRQEVDEVQEV
jgi:hypothetical protein